MKFTYLGTAAAEGFPAIFCNCKFCNRARQIGGKNIRTRSQALINDDLLLDIPSDTYAHSLNFDVRLDKIKYLLITHSHSDHFTTNEFLMRGSCFAHNMESKKLNVFSGNHVYSEYQKIVCSGMEQEVYDNILFNIVKPFETYQAGKYSVIPLPARHQSGTDAFIYVISEEKKSVLYAHDTGYFYPEVFDFLKTNKIYFDLISMDCTNIDIPISDQGSHMGLENVARATELLRCMGVINSKTKKYINHFSHNANPTHDRLTALAQKIGYDVAFDGLTVEV